MNAKAKPTQTASAESQGGAEASNNPAASAAADRAAAEAAAAKASADLAAAREATAKASADLAAAEAAARQAAEDRAAAERAAAQAAADRQAVEAAQAAQQFVVTTGTATTTEAPTISAEEAVKRVKRVRVFEDQGASRRVELPLHVDEVLAAKDHGTHLVVVTKDGQKFTDRAEA